MKKLQSQLVELLKIHGISGDEKPVREYLIPQLTKFMDMVKVDDYGNLLGEKRVGSGEGATILLSAHMDTVRGVLKNRKIVYKNGTLTSNKGALGADDRAGIAIILAVLRNINKTSFNGTIKVAFSREEEVGCIGSTNIDKDFYKDSDLAIVVDRKGNRDIVVGCGYAFCSDSVGVFMEDVAKMADMSDWRCVEGGVSDAMTFSGGGVNSVNLSAGYRFEHTEKEYVSIADMKDTVRLILQVFGVINTFYKTFDSLTFENRWIKNWDYGYSRGDSNYHYSNKYFEDVFEDDVWAEEYDANGDVYVYEVGKDIVIQQGTQEILLSRVSLRNLLKQLKNV